GVRKKYFINAPDAAMPEEWRNLPARHVRPGHRPGIVKQRPAIRRLDHRAAAVADREERAAQLVRRRSHRAADEQDAQPCQASGHEPAPAAVERIEHEEGEQRAVENPEPPFGHVRDVPPRPVPAVAQTNEILTRAQTPAGWVSEERNEWRHDNRAA